MPYKSNKNKTRFYHSKLYKLSSMPYPSCQCLTIQLLPRTICYTKQHSSERSSSNFSGEKLVGFGWRISLSCIGFSHGHSNFMPEKLEEEIFGRIHLSCIGLSHGLSGLKCFKTCIQQLPNYFNCH